jgi:hypothetical protein
MNGRDDNLHCPLQGRGVVFVCPFFFRPGIEWLCPGTVNRVRGMFCACGFNDCFFRMIPLCRDGMLSCSGCYPAASPVLPDGRPDAEQAQACS